MPAERSSRAEHLLACTLTFRDASLRDRVVPCDFPDSHRAISEWTAVLLHEAREAMREPLALRPPRPYLHPVDVDTDEPGIVDAVDEGRSGEVHVLRRRLEGVPRVSYRPGAPRSRNPCDDESASVAVCVVSREEADKTARAELAATLRKAQRSAATAVRREDKAREVKEARANETPEDRAARLSEERRKRAERKARKEAETGRAEAMENLAVGGDEDDAGQTIAPPPSAPPPPAPPPPASFAADPDVSATSLYAPPPPKRRRGKEAYFEHPLPHDRHLHGLSKADPAPSLTPALLRGDPCEDLEVIQGPPGTGKTRALVRRVPSRDRGVRVLLCAPTNVGAANLYTRCLHQGLGDECSLVLAPDRVPPGTAVESNDPGRRVVCATVSARSGPILDAHRFDAVFVDEAAMCMEAWTWTLLRREVSLLVLAGDVHQLPARASSSGVALRHERSLMERLVCDLRYDNVTVLEEQNRMAPALLRYPNDAFYEGRLRSGPHAPREEGRVEVHVLPGAREEGEDADADEDADGEGAAATRPVSTSSLRNRGESDFVRDVLLDPSSPSYVPEDAILLSPYAAQCRLMLALKSGREVHTVDSFQGREADVVVLSLVRDGTRGFGFWNDQRRLVVALTRARTRLVLLASNADAWPREAALARCVHDARSRHG